MNRQLAARQTHCARQMAVGDGHVVYVEECAAVDGLPVLFLPGGPGTGCAPQLSQLFDPQRFHAILPDPRGCGHSQPHGALQANTTPDLVADLDYVREALGLSAWIVFGGGWGSLLALAYAQLFPERVQGLVLQGVFLGSRSEIAAYVQGSNATPPAGWAAFAAAMPAAEQDDLLAAYARRILGPEPLAAAAAVRAWLDYERAQHGVPPLATPPDAAQIAQARVRLHYLLHDCFIAPGRLLDGIDRIRHIPTAIVHGTADPVCSPNIARTLYRAWPEATWLPVAGAGHGYSPPITRACSKALGWVAECVAG